MKWETYNLTVGVLAILKYFAMSAQHTHTHKWEGEGGRERESLYTNLLVRNTIHITATTGIPYFVAGHSSTIGLRCVCACVRVCVRMMQRVW